MKRSREPTYDRLRDHAGIEPSDHALEIREGNMHKRATTAPALHARLLLCGVSLVVFHCLGSITPGQAQPVPQVSDLLHEVVQLVEVIWVEHEVELLPTTAFLYAELGQADTAHRLYQRAVDLELERFAQDGPRLRLQSQYEGFVRAFSFRLRHIAELQTRAHDIRGREETMARFLKALEQYAGLGEKKLRSLADTLQEVARVQARLGDVQGALSTLQTYVVPLIEEGRKGPRPDRYTEFRLANTYLELGQRHMARALVQQWLTTIQTLPAGHGLWKEEFLHELPGILAKLGEDEELRRLLQRLGQIRDANSFIDQQEYVEAHLRAAEGLREAGERELGEAYVNTARTLALNNPVLKANPLYASKAWSHLAITEAKFGFIERAFDAAARIPLFDPELGVPLEDMKGYALWSIMKWYLYRGEFPRVHKIAQEAPPSTLMEIIVLQVNAGDARGAIQSFDILYRKLEAHNVLPMKAHPWNLLIPLQAVARARVLEHGIAAAWAWAKAQPAPDLKAFALLGVAEGIIETRQN